MKTKIVLNQLKFAGKEPCYDVVSLQNRTRPLIGEVLKESEVTKMLGEDKNLTIEIKTKK